MKLKHISFYWLIPILAFIPQLLMTLNSFNQIRQIISGLHVNVGWYGFLALVYKFFGFSLHTGKISYLVMAFFTNFALFYLLKKFFKIWIASLILLTITLSPTYLFMNALNLHWALTFHILVVILLLLYSLDFSKRGLSFVISGVIFYWLKFQAHLRGVGLVAFLLPLIMLFLWVDNKQMLLFDPETGSGLFKGGGKFSFSADIFSQAWTNFLSDFFVRGVSHHYEVAQAEFSLIFPIASACKFNHLNCQAIKYYDLETSSFKEFK